MGPDVESEDWDIPALQRELSQLFALAEDDFRGIDAAQLNSDELRDALWAKVVAKYKDKEKIVAARDSDQGRGDLMLQIVDQQWKDHLYSLDHLKEGIGLRGYGQRDPLVEYKKESFALFKDMRRRIEEEVVKYLWWLRPVVEQAATLAAPARPARRPGGRRRSTTTTRRRSGRRSLLTQPAAPPVTEDLRAGARARPCRRRRCDQDGKAGRTKDRPQRPLLVRQWQEVQEVPRG